MDAQSPIVGTSRPYHFGFPTGIFVVVVRRRSGSPPAFPRLIIVIGSVFFIRVRLLPFHRSSCSSSAPPARATATTSATTTSTAAIAPRRVVALVRIVRVYISRHVTPWPASPRVPAFGGECPSGGDGGGRVLGRGHATALAVESTARSRRGEFVGWHTPTTLHRSTTT